MLQLTADVLVLQVDEGKESFISLCGQFVPTTTGIALDLLPRLPDAIQKLPLATRKDLLGPVGDAREASTYSETGTPTKGKPPREIWRLLEHLMGVGEVTGLWTGTVPLGEVLAVLDALDSGTEIEASPRAVAHALLLVLYKLPSPLIPKEVHVLCKIVMTRDEVYAIVEKIPGVNANVSVCLGMKLTGRSLSGSRAWCACAAETRLTPTRSRRCRWLCSAARRRSWSRS